ncbi:hypothetical protein AVEN_109137-1 [Araneus ventricosus]|uniref:Uncharacterized protein n=1 Tax=Araneus ventricosus TaxID=182803 RepID=A0A4Y2KJ17_ARAVE|nr:hypothetical protein AVEN_109137-1 [Araneus ventricosus]
MCGGVNVSWSWAMCGGVKMCPSREQMNTSSLDFAADNAAKKPSALLATLSPLLTCRSGCRVNSIPNFFFHTCCPCYEGDIFTETLQKSKLTR